MLGKQKETLKVFGRVFVHRTSGLEITSLLTPPSLPRYHNEQF